MYTGGGYVQDIDHFEYSASPVYGGSTYYYNPTFTKIAKNTDFTTWDNVAIYTKNGNNYTYLGKVADIIANGAFRFEWQLLLCPTPPRRARRATTAMRPYPRRQATVFKATTGGYFKRTLSGYTYVGTGGDTVYSATGTTTATVVYKQIYFKGGYTNKRVVQAADLWPGQL